MHAGLHVTIHILDTHICMRNHEGTCEFTLLIHLGHRHCFVSAGRLGCACVCERERERVCMCMYVCLSVNK
jgi:hypothetical protein